MQFRVSAIHEDHALSHIDVATAPDYQKTIFTMLR